MRRAHLTISAAMFTSARTAHHARKSGGRCRRPRIPVAMTPMVPNGTPRPKFDMPAEMIGRSERHMGEAEWSARRPKRRSTTIRN